MWLLLQKKLHENEVGDTSVNLVAKSIVSSHLLLPSSSVVQDGVPMCARELLTLESVWLEFYDVIREADGDHILLSWKIMLPIFLSHTPH